MTKIKDVVTINEQATLTKGVQLSDFYNPEKHDVNERLAAGYVFGNGKTSNSSEKSSIEVFNYVRDTFNGYHSKNIFTIIARYGHGKSHFAIVLANYFGVSSDSPLLDKIIQQIENCTDKSSAEHFRSFKQTSGKPQLVVIISGHVIRDLRQGVLQALRQSLKANNIDYPIKAISNEAANWLESLEGKNHEKAQKFLDRHHRMNLKTLIDDLRNFSVGKENIAREIGKEILGVSPDFGREISLKEVIVDIVSNLCEGREAPFNKMLVLFDELGVYSRSWCNNQAAAGELAPQELIEACNDKEKNICLVNFIQRPLNEVIKDFPAAEECMKWAKRLPDDTQFKLVSNLEEVISKIVLPKDNDGEWKEVIRGIHPQLQKEAAFAKNSFEKYQNWNETDFYQVITRDCFPLHPLTTGILCNLNFTQGSRTIIEAVNSMIRKVEDKEVSNSGKLNWVKATDLFDVFERDFEKESDYSLYANAVRSIGHNVDKIYYDVLKALFLFNEGKLKRLMTANHVELLARLTEYNEKETRDAMQCLEKEFGVIRFNAANGEYQFTAIGNNSVELLKKLKAEIESKSLDEIAKEIRTKEVFNKLDLPSSEAVEFKREFSIESDEWYLEPAFFDAKELNLDNVKEFKKFCNISVENSKAKGAVIYVIIPNGRILDETRRNAKEVLAKLEETNYQYPIVIAIPENPASQLADKVLLKNKLYSFSKKEKDKNGLAYTEAVSRNDEELIEVLTEHLAKRNSVKFIAPPSIYNKIGNSENDLESISNATFSQYYKYRPPAISNLLKTNGIKGNGASATVAKQLINGQIDSASLASDHKSMINQVLKHGINKWGVLDNSYKIQEPTNLKVKRAWNEIFEHIQEDIPVTMSSFIRKLKFPPYGYDEYTLTLLLASFIGNYRYDLSFTENKRTIYLQDIAKKLDKKAKEFIRWLEKGSVSVKNAKKANRETAQNYLKELKNVETYESYEQLISEYDHILNQLEQRDGLYIEIVDTKIKLRPILEQKQEVQSKIGEIINKAEKSHDLNDLLSKRAELRRVVVNNKIDEDQSKKHRLAIEGRIECIATTQSKEVLTKIEDYSSVTGKLSRNKSLLDHYDYQELSKLYATALEKVEGQYKKLKAEKEEAPLLERLNAFHTSGMQLQYYEDSLELLKKIVEKKGSSKKIEQKAKLKRQETESEIDKLNQWVKKLSTRVKDASRSDSIKSLRDEIIRKERLFEGTNHSVELVEARTILENKLADIRKRQLIEEEQQRIKDELQREKNTARNITQNFEQLNNEEERFNCLSALIKIGKKSGLSDDQCKELIIILEK